MPAFGSDGMAARARHFLSEKDATAAPDVAAFSEKRLQFPQPVDALALRIPQLLEERLRVLPHLLRVSREQPLQSILSESGKRRRRLAQHCHNGFSDRLIARCPETFQHGRE